MDKKKLILLFSFLLAGCSVKKYDLAYAGIDLILEKNYGKDVVVEECYYTRSKEVTIGEHVVYNFSFINMYNQRTNRYFLYVNEDVYDESKEARNYYDLAIKSTYYIKLDINKLNEYIEG